MPFAIAFGNGGENAGMTVRANGPSGRAEPELAASARDAGQGLEPLRDRADGARRVLYGRGQARDERPVDPVARFHLGNGAAIEQLDWGADTSPKGLRQSAGIMVNDFYDLSAVEVRHQAFARHGHVTVGAPFRKLRRSFEGKKANNRVPAEG